MAQQLGRGHTAERATLEYGAQQIAEVAITPWQSLPEVHIVLTPARALILVKLKTPSCPACSWKVWTVGSAQKSRCLNLSTRPFTLRK